MSALRAALALLFEAKNKCSELYTDTAQTNGSERGDGHCRLANGVNGHGANPRARESRGLRETLTSLIVALVPVAGWLILFGAGVAAIPPALRPEIDTKLLPRLDSFVGYSFRWFENSGQYPWLDLIASWPYTIHPILPLIYLTIMWRTARHPRYITFIHTFGCMNLAAVVTHLVYPTAPPWYFAKYGNAPANYTMKGDPAVLARVDAITGSQFFTRMYRDGGKVVFGTWPSLHAAWPYLMAIFRPLPASRFWRFVLYFYVIWVWWAAMYLQHHFLADLFGGALYAELAYYFVTPKNGEGEPQPDDYDSVSTLPLPAVSSKSAE